MKSVFTGATCAAAVLATGIAVFAQTTQAPAQPAQTTPAPAADQSARPSDDAQPQSTIVGCVQREADYRRAKNEGSGGVAGTGVGTGNEFVLTNAGSASAAAAQPSTAPGAVGTSGSMASGDAYELTGSGEGQLEQFVGRRVEIVGRMKAATGASDRSTGVSAGGAASATSTPATGSATATGSASGRPAATGGADLMGQDLKLKEFEVVSVREAPGACPNSR